MTIPNPADTAASTSWTFPVGDGFTLLGEPALQLQATVAGTDAEIDARLWDVAPNGSATLVTRAAYRWQGSAGPVTIEYALQGNGWRFASDHRLRIQITQNDSPYVRLDSYASSVAYSSMILTLPVP